MTWKLQNVCEAFVGRLLGIIWLAVGCVLVDFWMTVNQQFEYSVNRDGVALKNLCLSYVACIRILKDALKELIQFVLALHTAAHASLWGFGFF